MNSLYEWLYELYGGFYSKVALGTGTALIWAGSISINTLFMVAGFVLGVCTMCINWYYKSKNSRIYAEGIRKGSVHNEPKD